MAKRENDMLGGDRDAYAVPDGNDVGLLVSGNPTFAFPSVDRCRTFTKGSSHRANTAEHGEDGVLVLHTNYVCES
ncbi:hypothetical protein U9J33_07185 [Novosphingobium sp. RL4]|nr:hypothetical protein [Novosphingobium sp. RL4]WRT94273.1 hypothetical protein U9J33_07185 [Novosphingobium sp. RL4]